MPELPRITRSLRMFTNLGRIKSTRELQPNDLFKKEEEYKKLKRYFIIDILWKTNIWSLLNH